MPEHLGQGDGEGQLVQGLQHLLTLPRYTILEKIPRPAEALEPVSLFTAAAGNAQTGVDTTQTDGVLLKQGWEGGFPLLLGEDKLSHVVIMQQDVECLHFIK